MYECFASMHICVLCTLLSILRGQKRALDTLELELQMAVSHYVGAGNQTLVLWKHSQWSKLLRRLQLHLSRSVWSLRFLCLSISSVCHHV